MNKQIALSIKQMKHLESLGLDTSDASMYWNEELNGPEITCHVNYYPNDLEVNETPAYTLQDILEKLPSTINGYDFVITKTNITWVVLYNQLDKAPLYDTWNESLLEASHQMLLWCIKNNYIKTNKV